MREREIQSEREREGEEREEREGEGRRGVPCAGMSSVRSLPDSHLDLLSLPPPRTIYLYLICPLGGSANRHAHTPVVRLSVRLS